MNAPALRRPVAASSAPNERMNVRVLPAVITLYACLLPSELVFQIAGVDFHPFRVAIVLMLPVAIVLAAQQRLRPTLPDALVLFAAVWTFLAMWTVQSLNAALTTGLSDGLNMALAYMVGRATIRTSKDFQKFFVAVVPGLLACAAIIAFESVLHQHILRPFIGGIFGAPPTVSYEARMGLMRAYGPFPHPILAGVFLGSFLPIAWYMSSRLSTRILGLVAVTGAFFTVSTGGMLAAAVGAGLVLTGFLHRVTRLPVFQVAIAATLGAMAFIQAFSQSGLFSVIIRRLTFDPQTGHWRLLIWEYAGADVMRNPIFGNGLREFTRPAWMITPSIDAHWLVIAFRYGLPASTAVLVAVVWAIFTSLRGAWSPYPLDRRAAFAMAFPLIAMSIAGLTVFYWSGIAAWFYVLTGMAVTFGQQMALASRTRLPGGVRLGLAAPGARLGLASSAAPRGFAR